ncbi:MAG: DUF4347 domain-containing protein [Leptolyngbyaceae cyanobacterium bins.349]|nr:DUF4347 domain-containing protein [Leptolyngbyaceae cyanobacterium bins.349]
MPRYPRLRRYNRTSPRLGEGKQVFSGFCTRFPTQTAARAIAGCAIGSPTAALSSPIAVHSHPLELHLMTMPLCLASTAAQTLAPTASVRSLIVIDAAVEHHQHFAAELLDSALVLNLDAHQDGIFQISELMQQHRDITDLHIIAHGRPGCVYLGNTELSLSTLDTYALHLMSWFLPGVETATPHTIALYSCQVAAGETGAHFLAQFQKLTGAAIAASTQPVGNARLGGVSHLDLFHSIHSIHSIHPDLTAAIATYPGLLNGELDRSFGNNGIVSTDIDPNSMDQLVSMTQQPDGKIIAIGVTNSRINSNTVIARYNPDGSLDASFGTGGKAQIDFGVLDYMTSVTVQPDGKIVLGGAIANEDKESAANFAVVRLNSDGSLDGGFGQGGRTILDLQNGSADVAMKVLVDGAGRILLVGGSATETGTTTTRDFALARFTPTGGIDTTFGQNGRVFTDFNSEPSELELATDAAIDANGRILVVGTGGQLDFAIARYLPNGQLDPSFGNGGKVLTDFTAPGSVFSADFANKMLLQPDGKIVVLGHLSADGGVIPAIARYNPDGSLDTSFGDGGKVITNFDRLLTSSNPQFVLQPDGKFVISGTVMNPNGQDTDVAIFRYLPNGQPDLGFGTNGAVYSDLGGTEEVASALLQADGKLVLGGSTTIDQADISLFRYNLGLTTTNRSPIAQPDNLTINENAVAIRVDVLANDTDPDRDSLSVTRIDTSNTRGQVTLTNGVVSYNPNGQFDQLAQGTAVLDTFSYEVSDGKGGTTTANVLVRVEGVNDAPIATNDAFNVNLQPGQPIRLTVADLLRNDRDVDLGDVLTVRDVGEAVNGTVTIDQAGNITFTPVANGAAMTGASFGYVIADQSGATSFARVTLINSPPPANIIEAAGNADLLDTNTGYQLRPDNGTAVSLRMGDMPVTSTSIPGWQAIGTEATATGYEVMWRAVDGQHGLWTVDRNGNALAFTPLSLTDVIAKEALFQQDFNGDRAIGPVVTATLEAAGNADLLDTNIGYQLRPDNGTAVFLRMGNTPVTSTSIPGWQAIGTEATATGYEVMWRAVDGQHGLWTVDRNGNALGFTPLSLTDVIAKEALFQQDFNGDNRIGNGTQPPPVGNVIEAAGNARLLSTPTGYQVQSGTATPVALTVNGSNLTDTSVPAWQPLGIERLAGGGYEMVLKSRTTADRYHLWEFDANGVHGNFRVISGAELLSKETTFQQDFNGDGRIAASTVFTVGPTNDVRIDSLLSGYKWGGTQEPGTTLTYSFATAVPTYYAADAPERNSFAPLSETQMSATRQALQLWSDVSGLRFTEVSTGGQLQFGTANLQNDINLFAWAHPIQTDGGSDRAGDVWLNNISPANNRTAPGVHGFQILLHEIGHALGLNHPFDGAVRLPAAQDSHQYTVMSYRVHPGAEYYPRTPMMYDILAMQQMYGANMTTRTGDDVYFWADQIATIWDAGGNDTLTAANRILPATINLNPGSFSSMGSVFDNEPTTATNNVAIAYGVTIENASGGQANDKLIGNRVNNVLTGNLGSDEFIFTSGRAFNSADFGVDTLADFSSAQGDAIVLSQSSFNALTVSGGAIATTEFAVINEPTNGAAGNLAAKLVYNQGTGDLFYNPNGAAGGFGDGGQFATLTGSPLLAATDFRIIA